eukprot:Nk52_evm1s1020 gene=Nk52_evmTU1s1020
MDIKAEPSVAITSLEAALPAQNTAIKASTTAAEDRLDKKIVKQEEKPHTHPSHGFPMPPSNNNTDDTIKSHTNNNDPANVSVNDKNFNGPTAASSASPPVNSSMAATATEAGDSVTSPSTATLPPGGLEYLIHQAQMSCAPPSSSFSSAPNDNGEANSTVVASSASTPYQQQGSHFHHPHTSMHTNTHHHFHVHPNQHQPVTAGSNNTNNTDTSNGNNSSATNNNTAGYYQQNHMMYPGQMTMYAPPPQSHYHSSKQQQQHLQYIPIPYQQQGQGLPTGHQQAHMAYPAPPNSGGTAETNSTHHNGQYSGPGDSFSHPGAPRAPHYIPSQTNGGVYGQDARYNVTYGPQHVERPNTPGSGAQLTRHGSSASIDYDPEGDVVKTSSSATAESLDAASEERVAAEYLANLMGMPRTDKSTTRKSSRKASTGSKSSRSTRKKRITSNKQASSPRVFEHDGNSASKPNKSFVAMISQVIMQSNEGALTVNDIYEGIKANYSYYATTTNMAWKNSVRHNLSLNSCFLRKVPDGKDPKAVKGAKWSLTKEGATIFSKFCFEENPNTTRRRSRNAIQAAVQELQDRNSRQGSTDLDTDEEEVDQEEEDDLDEEMEDHEQSHHDDEDERRGSNSSLASRESR